MNSSAKESISRFERLLAGLIASGVDYAVVGGVAVIASGYVRFTEDLDIIVKEAPDNICRLLACLERWGEGWARELKPEEFVPQEGSIRVMEDFDLDIFTRMRGRSLEDFRPRLRYLETSGVRIPYISPQDLVYLKQGSWRDKDKLDVLAMQEIIARESKSAS
ncbi:MAG: hypothetical protein FJ403_23160 [Verrucomicrobia bacterium]|nr:hypothetical protein [Verrucomicrobiota bacterium]